MRRCSKFKYINTHFVYSFFFFKRILKFKRPKWVYIKKRLFFFRRQFFYIFKGLKRVKRCLRKKKKLFLFLKFLKTFKTKKILPKIFLKFFYIFSLKLKLKSLKFFTRKIKRNIKKFYWLRKQKSSYPLFLKRRNYARIISSSFFNFSLVRISKPFIKRAKYLFKERLHMKFWVFKYFNTLYSIKYFKNTFKKYSNMKRVLNFSLIFIKLDTRLDLILYRVAFFTSAFLARFAIRNGLVEFFTCANKVFFQKKTEKLFPKKDTFIRILFSSPYSFKRVKKHFAPSFYLPSFIEIDYYLQEVIILKKFNEVDSYDLTNSIKEPLSFYKFKNFILK